jgi:hypothetical protein
MISGGCRHRLEPARLARIVGMRDHEGDIDAVRQQYLETADADIVVGEDNGTRHFGGSFPAAVSSSSNTARTV